MYEALHAVRCAEAAAAVLHAACAEAAAVCEVLHEAVCAEAAAVLHAAYAAVAAVCEVLHAAACEAAVRKALALFRIRPV